MQFVLPEHFQHIREVESLEKVKLILQEEAEEKNLKICYKLVARKKNFYLYCSKCDAKLQYQKISNDQRQYFVVRKIHNKHFHEFNNFRDNSRIIVEYLKNLPKGISLRSAKNLTLKTFSISSKQFYYYYNKIHFPKLKVRQLLQFFESINADIYIEPFNLTQERQPDVMVVISQKMKSNFEKYSEFCAFDCTFNLIKSEVKPPFKVGIIAGQSFSRKICPFAIVVCRHQTKLTFAMVLESFAKSMGRHPNLYISDQNIALIETLKEINLRNPEVRHTFDLFHVIKNAKRKLQDKKVTVALSGLAKCKNIVQFENMFERIQENLSQNDRKVVQKYIRNGEKYIYSVLPLQFIGLSSSDSFLQKCNDILKDHISLQKSFTTCLLKIFNVVQQLGDRCQQYEIQKSPVEIFYGLSQLKILRFKMDSKVLRQLCKEISKVSKNQILEESQEIGYYLVKDQQSQFQVKIQEQLSNCSCNFTLRSGIPCQHILTILIRRRLQIEPHINSRWVTKSPHVVDMQLVFSKKQQRGRGKRTRRNIMK